MKIQGLAIHCHHDILVEWCFDYDERITAIRNSKPQAEQKVRLKLFKILPHEAEKDMPKAWREAEKAYREAYEAWREAEKACREAYEAWSESEADKTWREAKMAWSETDKAWSEADKARREAKKACREAEKEAFHAKWCSCKNWDGKEIIF